MRASSASRWAVSRSCSARAPCWRARGLHLVDARRHLLQLHANRGERLQHGRITGRAGLGRLDAMRQLLGAGLPPGGLRAQRAHVLARLRGAARHRPHIPERSAHDQANKEKNK